MPDEVTQGLHQFALKEKCIQLKEDIWPKFFQAVLMPQREIPRAAAKEIIDDLEELGRLLPPTHQPPWIEFLRVPCSDFWRYPDNEHLGTLFLALLQNWSNIKAPIVTDVICDFDDICRKVISEHGMPALFDRLIEQLTQLLDSGEIDRVAASNALQRMVQILKSNRDGSYASVRATLFSVRTLWNIALSYLEDGPIVGPIITGIRKTLDESSNQMAAIDDAAVKQALIQLAEGLPTLNKAIQASKEFSVLDAQSRAIDSHPTLLIEGDGETPSDPAA